MGDILTGGNAIKGDRLSFQEINIIKNCYYGPEPSTPITGLLWRSNVDELLRQWDGAAWQIIPFYEVDTWVPVITFGGNAVDVTYDGATGGRYVRLGDWVTLSGWLFLSDKGSSNGDAKIEGLPFTSRDSPTSFVCPSLRLENISFANQHTSFLLSNTKHIWLQQVTEAGSLTQLTDANFANNSTIIISVTYERKV